tara:strand:- start:98 stop:436 length:339 start_codon:yes stop_codon:yes gene_type:complete
MTYVIFIVVGLYLIYNVLVIVILYQKIKFLNIKNEMKLVEKENYKLGTYLYMGMGKIKDKIVCLSVAYKIDYCIKKAREFTELIDELKFIKVNKIKIGELKSYDTLKIDQSL